MLCLVLPAGCGDETNPASRDKGPADTGARADGPTAEAGGDADLSIDLAALERGAREARAADGARREASAGDGPAGDGPTGEARPRDGAGGDGPSACKKFSGSIGEFCSQTSSTCSGGGTCLLLNTTGSAGVCTQSCTPDDPRTLKNEDTCPSSPANVCIPVALTDGTTKNFCWHACQPRIGCNECDTGIMCHPQSGAALGAYGVAVCLYPTTSASCTTGSDCPVSTGQACDTAKANCPTGQSCLGLAYDSTLSTDGICARSGQCDTVSGLCKSHTLGTATAKVGDPCTGDTDCANGMACLGELDETKYRKSKGQSCTYNSECCSGVCQNSACTAGTCRVNWRNGYCSVADCNFASSLTQAACPTGSVCNHIYTTGICQKTCSLSTASDCRGQSKDVWGDYECRAWDNVTSMTLGKITTSPVCDLGSFLPCSATGLTSTVTSCAQVGDTTNSTNMACRTLKNVVLSNPSAPNGFCLDDTGSGTAPAKPDAGVPDGGAAADSSTSDANATPDTVSAAQ